MSACFVEHRDYSALLSLVYDFIFVSQYQIVNENMFSDVQPRALYLTDSLD